MLYVQRHIRDNGLDSLKDAPYFLSINEYDSGLVVLNYNQKDSPKHDPIVKECRALILDAKNDYVVVARSFDRFFNYGECPETNEHNISNATIFDKIDGSLITTYHHDKKWNASTRKMAYAEGQNAFGNTYKQVFDKAFDIEKLTYYDKGLNLVFELVSPETRVVTPYTDYKVYLLTVRSRCDGTEYSLSIIKNIAKDLGIEVPRQYKMNSYQDVLDAIKDLRPFDEGYVALWDENKKHRIKIKNPGYLAIANLRMNGVLSEKRMVVLIATGEIEEYFSYFPEDKPFFQPYIDAYKYMMDDITCLWNTHRDAPTQKDFALAVKDKPVAPILFGMKKGKKTTEILNNMSDDVKLRIVKGYKK